MEKIAILTDAGSDVETIQTSLNWDNLFNCPLYINFGPESHKSNEITSKEFFEKVALVDKSNFPKTAAASPGDFIEIFNNIKSKGFTHILYIAVGSKLSATINSAKIAIDEVEGLQIKIVDTESVSIGQLGILLKAKQYLDENRSLDSVVSTLNSMAPNVEIFASLMTLDNLVKGGRMSPVRYWLGNLLKVKPVLRVNQGAVHPFQKTKGIENSRNAAFSHGLMRWKSTDSFLYIIGHGNNTDLGKEFESRLKSEYPNANGYVVPLGPILGVHTGQDSFLITTLPSD